MNEVIPKHLLFFFGVFLSLAIRLYFVLNGSDIADIHSLHEMGEVTMQGMNPYMVLNYNSYPPLAIYIEIINLSTFLNIPFHMLIKFWPNLADILMGFVIYLFLLKQKTSIKSAATWSLLFLLNPISILISSAHGQLDSITTLLTILAALILQFKTQKSLIFLSAILLGISVSIKPNPLVLLPIFLLFIYKKTNLFEKLIYIFLTIAPVVLLLTPFLKEDSSYVINRLINYSGSNDFGLAAILKTQYFYKEATYQLPNIDNLLRNSKIIFLILLATVIFLLKNSKDIIKLVLITYLLFITIYFGISAQYLSWVIPLAVLIKDKMIIPYSFLGLISLLGFYFYFNPAIILAQFANIQAYNLQVMNIYAVSNFFFWAVNLLWIIKLTASRLKQ